MGKCRFQDIWMEKTDVNGDKFSIWVKKEAHNDRILCKVCEKSVYILRGLQSLQQHAQGEKHINMCKLKLKCQLHLTTTTTTTTQVGVNRDNTSSSSAVVQIYRPRENSIKAELIWVMRSVVHNYSFLSCEGINEAFRVMFPCEASSLFSLSPTKIRYLVSDALGPYFQQILMEDAAGKFFVYVTKERGKMLIIKTF